MLNLKSSIVLLKDISKGFIMIHCEPFLDQVIHENNSLVLTKVSVPENSKVA